MHKGFTAILLLLLIGSIAVSWGRFVNATPDDLLLSAGQIQELSELTTLSVPVTEVLTLERAGPLRLGTTRVMLAVQGHALLATPISADSFEQIDETERSAVLLLKVPRVSQAIIDHEQSKVYSLGRSGLWALALWSDADRELVNEAYRDAQVSIREAGGQPHYLQQAMYHTEQVIGAWFAQLGWKVVIRWLKTEA